MNLKPYDTCLLVGRFQSPGPHNGHQLLINTAQQLADRVIVGIGSSQEYGTERNPFKASTRMNRFKAVYGDSLTMFELPDLTNENDITPEWGNYVLDKARTVIHKKPDVIIYGNDEERSRWFAKSDVSWVEIMVPRSIIQICATECRMDLLFDKRTEYYSKVHPRMHKFYDEDRAELLEAKFYRELYDKTMRMSIPAKPKAGLLKPWSDYES